MDYIPVDTALKVKGYRSIIERKTQTNCRGGFMLVIIDRAINLRTKPAQPTDNRSIA